MLEIHAPENEVGLPNDIESTCHFGMENLGILGKDQTYKVRVIKEVNVGMLTCLHMQH